MLVPGVVTTVVPPELSLGVLLMTVAEADNQCYLRSALLVPRMHWPPSQVSQRT